LRPVGVTSRPVGVALNRGRVELPYIGAALFQPRVSPSELGAATSTWADPWRRGDAVSLGRLEGRGGSARSRSRRLGVLGPAHSGLEQPLGRAPPTKGVSDHHG
jgi:hypothetical protein